MFIKSKYGKVIQMTKIIKLGGEKPNTERQKLTREMIAKLGETMYSSEDVKGVRMQVVFKDNSSIAFKRSEMADTFELMEGD
jgi:hypothetical protein